jgi:hypothetical protein
VASRRPASSSRFGNSWNRDPSSSPAQATKTLPNTGGIEAVVVTNAVGCGDVLALALSKPSLPNQRAIAQLIGALMDTQLDGSTGNQEAVSPCRRGSPNERRYCDDHNSARIHLGHPFQLTVALRHSRRLLQPAAKGDAQAIVDRVLERGCLLHLHGPSMRTKHLGLDAAAVVEAPSDQVVRISGDQWLELPDPQGVAVRNRPIGARLGNYRVEEPVHRCR